MDVPGVTHRRIDVGEVTLHVAEAGEGPPVVLLHGFPDGWYTWRRQLPALAGAGWRAVAPDLRGYGASSRPRGVAAYALERLVADVARLIASYGESAAVVAHDWGGGIAWALAMTHPELVVRLGILNAPHPVSFARAWRHPRQLLRSRYMLFFQIPALPERSLAAGDFDGLRRIYRRAPRAFSAAEIGRHVDALRPPGALTAAVTYYRALFRGAGRAMRMWRRVDVPALVVWGDRDPYLGRELADPPSAWVRKARVVHLPDAGHWVHLEEPDAVNAELVSFLRTS